MSLKCLFRNDDGSYCKRWAQKESRFCYNHQPQGLDGPGGADWPSLHPFTRLATPCDLFDLLRESLNAARMGTMPAAQAASICSLATLWLKTYEKMEYDDRIHALHHQILPTLVDAESAAHAERLAAATAETERAASFAAELDHIAKFGPPAPPPDADGPQPPTSDASQPPAPAAETPPPNSEPPRQPVNLREAQAKLDAMLADQRAAKSPANPNGSG